MVSVPTLDTHDLLFQVVDLFPLAIQIFDPQGTTLFVNQAFLKVHNIADPAQVVGHYNITQDPGVMDVPCLRDAVKRVFRGETVTLTDVRIPTGASSRKRELRRIPCDTRTLYQDITGYPVMVQGGEITCVVVLFRTTRTFTERADIARAKEYIENHWLEEFDMEKIAQAVNLSRYHFCRLFKKHTSMTLYDYYLEVKIQKLKESLRDQNLTITQAFAACGVTYSGHYARLFKKKTGLTPSEYREMVWKQLPLSRRAITRLN